jgi:hypothetical protein
MFDGYGFVNDDNCVGVRCEVCLLFVGGFGGMFMDGVMRIVQWFVLGHKFNLYIFSNICI